MGVLEGAYIPNFTGWITVKVKNSVRTNPMQKCWVNVTYAAPAVVVDAVSASARNTASVWTGNAGTNQWNEKGNWEEGILPEETSDVLIPEGNEPYPKLDEKIQLESLRIEVGASLVLNADLYVNQTLNLEGQLIGNGSIHHAEYTLIRAQGDVIAEFSLFPNPSSEGVSLLVQNLPVNAVISLEIFGVDGKLIATTSGNYLAVNDWTRNLTASLPTGVYVVRCQMNDSLNSLRFIKTANKSY
jgi:hypothetical protein